MEQMGFVRVLGKMINIGTDTRASLIADASRATQHKN